MKRLTAVLVTTVAGLIMVGIAVAGWNDNWSSHLRGSSEIPARDTNAQGQLILNLSDDGSTMHYKLIASNIENVFQAHIHMGTFDVNGPVVVFLYPNNTGPALGPPAAGRTDGVLVEGTFTAAQFIGPLAGKPMSDLVALLNTGGAYGNVHTTDFVLPANTGPGDFPGGEIRGTID